MLRKVLSALQGVLTKSWVRQRCGDSRIHDGVGISSTGRVALCETEQEYLRDSRLGRDVLFSSHAFLNTDEGRRRTGQGGWALNSTRLPAPEFAERLRLGIQPLTMPRANTSRSLSLTLLSNHHHARRRRRLDSPDSTSNQSMAGPIRAHEFGSGAYTVSSRMTLKAD